MCPFQALFSPAFATAVSILTPLATSLAALCKAPDGGLSPTTAGQCFSGHSTNIALLAHRAGDDQLLHSCQMKQMDREE